MEIWKPHRKQFKNYTQMDTLVMETEENRGLMSEKQGKILLDVEPY